MKKIFNSVLMIVYILLSLIFIYNFLILNFAAWNWLFFSGIILSVTAQIVNLNNFKIGKRILLVLLMVLLTFVSFLITFLIPGYLFPYSETTDISLVAVLVGIPITFANFTIFYSILTIFINKLKQNEKPKKAYVKLISIYTIIVTFIETIIMILANK